MDDYIIKAKKNYYLAHSFILRKIVRAWQLQIEKRYNINLVNPFYRNKWEMEQIKKMEELPEGEQDKGLPDWKIIDCVRIMEEDLNLIRQSDGIVAFFDAPTIGTCQEIFAAAYLYRIPVYVITNKYHNHPWLRALVFMSSGGLFRNMFDFSKWLEDEGLRR